jgi:ribosomal protein S18 acetylase RimI-like enzyme
MTARAALLRRELQTKDGRRCLVRPAGTGDAAALVGLRDAVAAEPGLISTLPGEVSVTEQALLIDASLAEGDLMLVAEVDGDVAAELVVRRRPGRYERHVGEVAIVVSNMARGVGAGRALMETAVEWARAVGLAKLELSVFSGNQRAIALYRRIGFSDEGLRRAAVRMPDGEHDLLLMALPL